MKGQNKMAESGNRFSHFYLIYYLFRLIVEIHPALQAVLNSSL